MKRVLITGAAGFIGTHTLGILQAKGYDVHAVSARARAAESSIEWHQANLLDSSSAGDLIKRVRPSHLLHLAWVTAHGQFWAATENLAWVQSSLEMMRHFAENDGRRFVFASTCAVYDVSHGSLVEDLTPTKPANLYGSCKLAVENVLQAFAAQTGVSAASGRVFHLFGPSEDSRRFVPSIIIPLLQRRTAVCRNRDQILDFLYVEDVAAAFCALLESTEAGAVNFGSGTPIRLGEFAAKIATKIGHDEALELQTDPTQKQLVLTPDVTKLAQRIRWHPAVTLDKALDKTIEWWRAQPIT
jgi:nucleoside-diphosphate-sugar epimerase